ncbi:hypothetical protein Ga0100231_018635 [Opitutaceae bacterium TAV4]|uniref:hypothetical protein n=1 Tax=Geminisphaera colitermitum TaxID=1148786 RepID=UPI000158C5A8|nr:hypothetical protein [Geminisphaera colitermitum]RRJ95978.1 hypothetical protein Ga0100231_018635 [Opitutaceae bacterium TAV4]
MPSSFFRKPAAPAVLVLSLAGLMLALLSGCASIGPSTIPRDRFGYSSAVTESWKRQTLLNIVKLRYLDPPIYVDVGQIVAGYQIEMFGGLGTEIHGPGGSGDSFGSAQLQGRYIDRPTITYTPMTGSKFMAGFVAPFSPAALFSTIQIGWPADAMLLLGVSAINGLRNEEATRRADDDFIRVATLMHQLQVSGDMTIRIISKKDSTHDTLITLRSRKVSEETLARAAELRRLLGLNPTAVEFHLVHGIHAASDTEIAIQTRSLLHITGALALHADIPGEDIKSGRATRGVEYDPAPVPDFASTPVDSGGAEAETAQLSRKGFHILSGPREPSPRDVLVAVPYRGHWFWVADNDLRTKRAFSLLMLLFTMSDTSGDGRPPILTISTN